MSFHSSLRQGAWLTVARVRAYSLILLIATVIALAGWLALAPIWHQSGWRDRQGTPVGADFVNVYAAGMLTDRGAAPLAYDWPRHKAVEDAVAGPGGDTYYGWNYPPVFLLVAAGVALLPYGWALVAYLGAGLAAYAMALRLLVPMRGAWLPILGFPGVLIDLANGQNGFITAALFAVGLSWLETNPWLAGLALGGLIYKPQYLILVPLALAAGRCWPALAATLLTAACLCILSWAAFGAGTWQAFLASTHQTQTAVLEQGGAGWGKLQSSFAVLRGCGLNLPAAYAAQGLVALCAVTALVRLWRDPARTPADKGAALCLAALLATPYLFDYDLALLAVPVALLAMQGLRTGFRPYERTLLALVWSWPLLARAVGMHFVPLTPIVLAALLLVCARNEKAETEVPAFRRIL